MTFTQSCLFSFYFFSRLSLETCLSFFPAFASSSAPSLFCLFSSLSSCFSPSLINFISPQHTNCSLPFGQLSHGNRLSSLFAHISLIIGTVFLYPTVFSQISHICTSMLSELIIFFIIDQEPELYFKEPEELLQVLTELEEQNLTLVQYSQDVDENLEDVNKREKVIQDKM